MDKLDTFNITRFINAIRFNIFRIIFIIIVFWGLWLLYYTNAPRIYEIKSGLQIQQRANSNVSYEDVLFGGSDNIDLEEQIKLYSSHTNRLSLIQNLKLNLIFNSKPLDVPEKNPIDIDLYADLPIEENTIVFNVKNRGDGSYDLLDADGETLYSNLNTKNNYNLNNIEINIKEFNSDDEVIQILYMTPEFAIKAYLEGMLNLNQMVPARAFVQKTQLLEVSYFSPNVILGKRIVNEANRIFLEDSIESNTEEAKQSLQYLGMQINRVKDELEISEKKLNTFKEENTSVDINLEVQSLIQQQQKILEQIKSTELRYEELTALYKPGNPLLQNLDNQRNILLDQSRRINEEIVKLPEAQKDLISLVREVEVNQTFLDELMRRQLEFSIIEASTLSNARIIDEAYVDGRVSPRGFNSLIFFTFLGGLIGLVYALTRQFLFLPIQLPSEINELLPEGKLMGILPQFEDLNDPSNTESESLNSVVTNLNLASQAKENDHKILLVTGPTAGVGKSTVSAKIASTLAARGKRTILIDMDQKKGDQHKIHNIPKLRSTEEYFNIDNFDQYKINENLFVIPKAKGGSSDALSVIESERFKNFINSLKEIFDQVIIDTPPVISLSESLALSVLADDILMVYRHGVSKLREVEISRDQFSSIGIDSLLYVYNCFKKPSGYYGYDYYAYKYYGNYDYYTEEDKD